MGVRTSLCSDAVMTRTTIAPSTSTTSIISPVRAGVRCRSYKRTIAEPMRIATSPVQQAWLSRQAIWWRGDGDPASIGMVSRQDMEKAVQTIVHPAMIWEERA